MYVKLAGKTWIAEVLVSMLRHMHIADKPCPPNLPYPLETNLLAICQQAGLNL